MEGNPPAGQSPALNLKGVIDWLLAADWTYVGSLGLLALVIYLLVTSRMAKRLVAVLEDTVFSNWRLALLGATGLVLSVASGWTTWDGMRNFTHEPTLSFMITFGIQGVMLIVAWLIGESFATGMSVRAREGDRTGLGKGMQATLGAIVGVLLFIAVVMFGPFSPAPVSSGPAPFSPSGWGEIGDKLLIVVVGLLAAALLVVYASSDLVRPYLQSSRVIVRNAVLWVMFLACMGTSVFFSFDSLFSTIFPQEERKRAAEIRAINQISSVVADIGTLAAKRQIEEAKALFESESWANYETELDKVQELARRAPDEIRKQLTIELEAQRSRIAELEEKRASAEAGQAGLLTRKTQYNEEISRLQADRPDAAARTLEYKAIVTDIEKRLDEQRTKTLAEEKGVEGSGKVGRGQFYRASKEEEAKLQAELLVAKERLKGHEQRLTGIDRRLAQIKAELAQIDGDLAKLKGEVATAGQMIAVAQSGSTENAERYDPASGVAALIRERQAFRQRPEQATLATIQAQCAALIGASTKVASLRDAAAGIDCNPRQATEAAARVFALNAGIRTFEANCAGGDKLPAGASTDTLLEFGRKCLQDSGLPSKDVAAMGATLSAVALNRDDKAHRFVVTWNAFEDGNRLAYLALAIAIAIDALVFMSGLFGANVVRSPLSDVPSLKARSAQQLEAIIENALIPAKFENAHAVLEAMQPITPVDGFTQEVVIPYHDTPERPRVLKVLNAAATIGAVERDPTRPERYLVRPELFEFLSVVAKKAYEADADNARVSELKQMILVALQPHVGDHADIVLDHMHPINEKDGFASEVTLSTVPAIDLPIVRKVLNSGSMLRFVSHDARKGEEDRFYVHKDLYKTLAMISATYPKTGGRHGQPQIEAIQQPGGPRGTRDGGRLKEDLPRIVTENKRKLSAPAKQITGKQTPPGGRQPMSRESQEEFDMRMGFLRDLIGAVGIDPDLYVELQGRRMAAAISAGDAFHAERQGNKLLDRELDNRDERAKDALDNQRSIIEGRLKPDDVRRRGAVKAAYDEIDANWRAIMLLPSGPYEQVLEQLIADLEPQSGDGVLPPEAEDLLVRAKHLYNVLGLSPRSSSESWERLEASLRDASGTETTRNINGKWR